MRYSRRRRSGRRSFSRGRRRSSFKRRRTRSVRPMRVGWRM